MGAAHRRLAGVIALLGLAAASWLVPWVERLPPGVRARHRWWVVALEDGARPRPWSTLFVDATGAPVETLWPGRVGYATVGGLAVPQPLAQVEGGPAEGQAWTWRRAVHASATPCPADPWGHPWLLQLVVLLPGQKRLDDRTVAVWSAGPDGRWEWGTGDDVLIGPLEPTAFHVENGVTRPADVPFDVRWPLALAALAGGWGWLAWHAWRASRSPRLGVEVPRVLLLGGPPGVALVWALPAVGVDPALGGASGLLVSRDTAVGATLLGLLVGLAGWRRLTRPPAPPP